MKLTINNRFFIYIRDFYIMFIFVIFYMLFLQIIHGIFVVSHPVGTPQDESVHINQEKTLNGDSEPKSDNTTDSINEKVISVRITSSVAIGRTKTKQPKVYANNHEIESKESSTDTTSTETLQTTIVSNFTGNDDTKIKITEVPPELLGANIEFIKQLDAKKKAKQHNLDQIHPCELLNKHQHYNENEEILEQSPSTIHEHGDIDDIEEIPTARKIPSSSFINYLHEGKEPNDVVIVDDFESSKLKQNNMNLKKSSSVDSSLDELLLNSTYSNNEDLKNVNRSLLILSPNKKQITPEHGQVEGNHKSEFNVTDDSLAESSFQSAIEVATNTNDKIFNKLEPQNLPAAVSQQNYYQDFSNKQSNGRRSRPRLTTVSFNIVHDAPQTATANNHPTNYMYSSQSLEEQQQNVQLPKVYSEPARIYSEPAKFYSEPAKIYSEPAKIYSEPAKVYSEPAKIYSVPAKFYSEPASLHLDPSVSQTLAPWQQPSQAQFIDTTTIETTPATTIADTFITKKSEGTEDPQPEKNYEVDENVSILTNGRSHGVQETTTEKCKQDNCKVGYVVEGRQFKKYRVEERTSDGFIVGEYGVVRNEDGALRGVRYTADSDASPRLIYDALMKFLQLR